VRLRFQLSDPRALEMTSNGEIGVRVMPPSRV
jgi:hypothetical protein